MNVVAFAREGDVAKMRELLLEHGAKEDDADRDRWELRQRADRCERIRFAKEREIGEIRDCEVLAPTPYDDDL